MPRTSRVLVEGGKVIATGDREGKREGRTPKPPYCTVIKVSNHPTLAGSQQKPPIPCCRYMRTETLPCPVILDRRQVACSVFLVFFFSFPMATLVHSPPSPKFPSTVDALKTDPVLFLGFPRSLPPLFVFCLSFFFGTAHYTGFLRYSLLFLYPPPVTPAVAVFLRIRPRSKHLAVLSDCLLGGWVA